MRAFLIARLRQTRTNKKTGEIVIAMVVRVICETRDYI